MKERVPLGRNARAAWLVAAVLALVVILLAALLMREGGSDAAATGGANPSTTPITSTTGSGGTDDVAGLRLVDLAALPAQAQQTVTLIQQGGPYPYRKDGATFGNREGLLPKRARGYYREYTVETPGSDDRGARRIVTGDDDREFFYTDDHYRTFRRVRL